MGVAWIMWCDNRPVTFYGELAVLVDEVADRVDRWTGHAAWAESAGSLAAAEFANSEVRQDGSPWGERPVRTVYAYAQMEIKLVMGLSLNSAMRHEEIMRSTPAIRQPDSQRGTSWDR
jgi:hypothetical protein